MKKFLIQAKETKTYLQDKPSDGWKEVASFVSYSEAMKNCPEDSRSEDGTETVYRIVEVEV
jgi:hypothetical protein